MHHFCTLFDRNYIDRGLALLRSLERHCTALKVHVLCLDDATFEALSALQLAKANLIRLPWLEDWDPELALAKTNRAPVEFFYTCKPVLLSYVMDHNRQAERVDYLDSDLYCFFSPDSPESEYVCSSVALSPHRFSGPNAYLTTRGRFNAGWLSVSAGGEGRRFLDWWRERCLEWCHAVVEETRFGDQKYLDEVPKLFDRVIAVSHPGVNLAPWNVGDSRIEVTKSTVMVDGMPLVFFHFHAMKRMFFNRYETNLPAYGTTLTTAIRRGIYLPYVTELRASRSSLAGLPTELHRQLHGDRRQRTVLENMRSLAHTVRGVARHSTISR